MKRIFLIVAVIALTALAAGSAFALDKPVVQPSVSGGAEWLAAELPLKTWLGMPESERMKVARNFADDYYSMDKGCSYAKVKAVYNDQKERAFIYVECTERSTPKTDGVKKSPFGT